MKQFKLFPFFISVVLIEMLACGCHENKDAGFPVIKIDKPSRDTHYQFGDTIRFQAELSDASQITSIEVQLMDGDNKPMMPVVSASPGKPQFTFKGEYVLNDPQLPNGTYQLRFRASNGENLTNQFLQLQYQELEKELLFPLVILHPDPNRWVAYKFVNNQWQQVCVHTGDFSGSAVNAADTVLYMCGDYNSKLSAIRLRDGLELWNVSPTMFQSSHWFGDVALANSKLYVGCAEGTMKAYNKSGTEVFKSVKYASASPVKCVVTDNLVIGFFVNTYDSQKHFVAFHNTGGALLDTKFYSGDVVQMMHTNGDEALIVANKDGHGEILQYMRYSDSIIGLKKFYGGVFCSAVMVDSNTLLVSSNIGIYTYHISSNVLEPFASAPVSAILGYDDVLQEVYACYGKKLDVFSYPHPSLIRSVVLPDTAVRLHLVFNK